MQNNLIVVKIKDIAILSRPKVFTPAQTIEDIVAQEKESVYGPVLYNVGRQDNFFVANKAVVSPSIRILPIEGWNAHYISFWLNSSDADAYFASKKKKLSFQLSKDAVGNYTIFVLPNQQAVVSIDKIIAHLHAKQTLDEFQTLELKYFCELRDGICYQYSHAEKLSNYECQLYQEWVALWGSICENENQFDEYISQLYVQFIHPESPVRSEMKRLRVIKNSL